MEARLYEMSEILAMIGTFMEKLTFCLLRFNHSTQIFTVVGATVGLINRKKIISQIIGLTQALRLKGVLGELKCLDHYTCRLCCVNPKVN